MFETLRKVSKRFSLSEGKSAEAKPLSCIKGSIYDVVGDLRPNQDIW